MSVQNDQTHTRSAGYSKMRILRVWLLMTFQSTSAVHGRPRFERRFSCCIRPLIVVRPSVDGQAPNPPLC